MLSKQHTIPSYAEKKMDKIEEYTYDTIKKTFAISPHNLKLIDELPEKSSLKRLITESYPINHIISRELCILYFMKIYFYIIENSDKSIKPFILISKYKLKNIKDFYKKYKKPMPNIKYLFKQLKK